MFGESFSVSGFLLPSCSLMNLEPQGGTIFLSVGPSRVFCFVLMLDRRVYFALAQNCSPDRTEPGDPKTDPSRQEMGASQLEISDWSDGESFVSVVKGKASESERLERRFGGLASSSRTSSTFWGLDHFGGKWQVQTFCGQSKQEVRWASTLLRGDP